MTTQHGNNGTSLHPPPPSEADNTVAINTWGESLIEFAQLGQCNMQVKTAHHQDINLRISAHPILDYYFPADDDISREDLINCLLQHELYYIEELYTYPHNPDSEEEPAILQLITGKAHEFLRTVWYDSRDSDISHGRVFLRPGMIITNHQGERPDKFYEIESFLINEGHNEDTTGKIRLAEWEATDDTEMDDGTVLLSASRAQDPSFWPMYETNFKEGTETTFRRFFTGPVNEGHRQQQYNGIIQSLLIYQPSHTLIHPHIPTCTPSIDTILQAWEDSRVEGVSRTVFTDGSVQAREISPHLQLLSEEAQIGISVAFVTAPVSPDPNSKIELLTRSQQLVGWRIQGKSSEFCSYDTETIAATAASLLPGPKLILTDSQALEKRIASQLICAHDGTAIDADTRVSLLTKQRNATDITLVGEGLLHQCIAGRAELRFIPNHSENRKK